MELERKAEDEKRSISDKMQKQMQEEIARVRKEEQDRLR